jgi:type II secretory pathway component PulF
MTNDKFNGDDAIEFARGVGGLASAGVALPGGLRALGEELPRGPLRAALTRVAARIEEGESLEEAVGAQGERFPAHLEGMVRAGLRTGRLGEVLGRFVRYERIGEELRRRLWMSLAYPLLLVTSLALLFVFVSHMVMRDLEKIVSDFGIQLPGITVALLRTSKGLADADWGLLVVPLALLAFAWLGSKGLLGAPRRRRIANRLPLIGPLRRWTALAEFAHLLALLIESEVPLTEALPMAADGVRDADLAELSRRMVAEIERDGLTLSQALLRQRVFPMSAARLIRWAQDQDSLPEALRMIGDIFEARARAQVGFIGIFCLVVAIFLVIWGIIFILGGIYLPMIRLISRLSG